MQLYISKHVDNFVVQSEKRDAVTSITGRFGLLIMPFSSYLSFKVSEKICEPFVNSFLPADSTQLRAVLGYSQRFTHTADTGLYEPPLTVIQQSCLL